MNDAQTRSFYERLNLDYPGLEAVKSAVRSGDYDAAGEALVQHYRHRARPGWYWDKDNAREVFSSLDGTSADDVLARKFTVLLKTAQLERKIDWAVNPFGDREWAWLLNRHQFFQTLGMAYLRTGDEKYAAEFNEILTDWILSNPVPEQCDNSGPHWRTIEAGIRMFSSWPASWHFFKDSPSFTAEARILMLKSFAEHADYLMKYPTSGNWTLMENNGLLHVGALFPEFTDAPKWRETAIERLAKEMEKQVYPDGAQFELTTSYHNVSLWNFLHPAALKGIADGIDFPPEYYEGLRRMILFDAGVERPDGKWPMLNDSDDGSADEWIISQAKNIGADRQPEIRAVLDVPPAKESVFFPYAGISCMRTGSDPQDLYLMMDAGPFGASHQHEDKLNLEVYAYGRAVVLDPGRYSYYDGAPFHGPGAHSTILVDGMGQNRRSTDRGRWIVTEPAPGNRWVTSKDFDYAEGIYDEGFGPENDLSVTHTRKVFFVKPEYWIVVDVLHGEGEHKFEQMWHFAPGSVETDTGIARTTAPGSANLAVVRSDSADVRIVEGQETPILGYVSYRYNEREPAPTAVFTRTCAVPATFETVLYPSAAGQTIAPKVTRIGCLVNGRRPNDGQVSAISIRLPECEDIFVMCHDEDIAGCTKRFLDFEFTGEAVWIRTDLRGNVVKTLILGKGSLVAKD